MGYGERSKKSPNLGEIDQMKNPNAKKLTNIVIRNLKPTANRQEIPDADMPGLYLIVQRTGTKSWAFRYHGKDGKAKKLTLGAFTEDPKDDAFTIGEAHKAAIAFKEKLREGVDPHAEAILAKQGEDEGSFEYVAADFVKRHIQAKNKPSTQYEHTRLLNSEIIPAWNGKKIRDITLRDFDKLIQAKIDKGHGTTSNRVHALVSTLFNWAKKKGYVDTNVVAGIKKEAKETSRDRFLDQNELRLCWLAADRIGYPFGDVVKLLILTGQRRDEVARMSWPEIEFNGNVANFHGPIFTIPEPRAKNGTKALIPLVPTVVKIIKAAPKLAPGQGKAPVWVFTHDGKLPVRGYTKNKAKLDKTILAIMKEEAIARGQDPETVTALPRWTLHDLRRTFSTLGAEDLDIQQDIIDSIQNHKKKGMTEVYNKAQFLRKKEITLQRWAEYVAIVARGGKVKLVYDAPRVVEIAA